MDNLEKAELAAQYLGKASAVRRVAEVLDRSGNWGDGPWYKGKINLGREALGLQRNYWLARAVEKAERQGLLTSKQEQSVYYYKLSPFGMLVLMVLRGGAAQ